MLEKYSIGMGDRFGRQGEAQLRAVLKAEEEGVLVTPVWNKSHREHVIIGSSPADVREEADAAVQAGGWKESYYVDADHISLENVDWFADASDYFTLDVSEQIGSSSPEGAEDTSAFVSRYEKYIGNISVPCMEDGLDISMDTFASAASKFLGAVREAGRIYRRICEKKGDDSFVTEVSMDETDTPQSPEEMFVILAAVADEEIPIDTIAPKFTGRFNKGVDYQGDLQQFAREFDADVAVVAYAVKEFGLPSGLKLSVHSGSDKFSLYGILRDTVRKHNAGLHVKTAGTTWLEELIGLATAGGKGLEIAKEVYASAMDRVEELCGPYRTVIDIDSAQLPSVDAVAKWTERDFADALRHDQSCKAYNPHLRQLLHASYKIAAEMGNRYLDALDAHREVVGRQVTENLYERHLRRIFLGD